MKILITGPPKCGKTTFIKNLFKELKDLKPAGFYTEEIRAGGNRVGFEIYDQDFKFCGTLAHIKFNTPYKVSKYCVDVENFEKFLKKLNLEEYKIIIIDEIGKMEVFSDYFKKLIIKILNSDKVFIGTIALYGNPFIEEIKKKKDLKIFNLEFEKRDVILNIIKEELWKKANMV